MNRRTFTHLLVGTAALAALPGGATAEPEKRGPVWVELKTSEGGIVLELYPDKAPVTVENFLSYVKHRHYDGTIFHRVIPGFVIQGGGYTKELKEKPTRDPIKNEASNGLRNERGTIAMARTREPDSATAQFFINLRDNPFLDADRAADMFGYAVFGKVIRGMEVVDRIARVRTGNGPNGFQDVPVRPVIIRSARVLSERPADQPSGQER